MIVICCDASPKIGFGHLVRCRALAMALRDVGESCIMVGPDTEYMTEADTMIFQDWIPRNSWRCISEDANFLLDVALSYGAHAAILDDYRVDERYQLILRKRGLLWVQFDGLADEPLWADMVINANPAMQACDYASVVRNPATKLLLGPKFAILRPEFAQVRRRHRSGSVGRVLVTFGGGDDRGAIQFVLSTLMPLVPQSVQFLVISGTHNPRNSEVKACIEPYDHRLVRLAVNPSTVAPLMDSCDVAVMGGGTSTYEAACCGLPMLLVSIAVNQISQSRAWEARGAAVFLGMYPDFSDSQLSAAFFGLLGNSWRRTDMSRQAYKLVDGQGAQRVANKILQGLNP